MSLSRLRRACWTLATLLIASAPSLSAQRDVPKIVRDGLEAFRVQGVDAGIRALTPQWTLESDRANQDYLIETFGKITPAAGRVTGSDIAAIHDVSAHVRKVYVVLLFERMPVYMVLTTFQPIDKDWAVVNITFNTNVKEIFPAWMVDPQAPK